MSGAGEQANTSQDKHIREGTLPHALNHHQITHTFDLQISQMNLPSSAQRSTPEHGIMLRARP